MPVSKLFEADESIPDTTIWSGENNGTLIEIFDREDTGAEEIYALVDNGDIVKAAVDLANFLEDSPVDGIPFDAHLDPEDPTSVVITFNEQDYTSYSIETCEETGDLFITTDLQLEDDEIEYLKQNGKLPPYSDEELDSYDNGDDDFWD